MKLVDICLRLFLLPEALEPFAHCVSLADAVEKVMAWSHVEISGRIVMLGLACGALAEIVVLVHGEKPPSAPSHEA
jgi:hypothetical protein